MSIKFAAAARLYAYKNTRTRKKILMKFGQDAGWTPDPVWGGAENLAPTGIWSPDRPASSEPLHRLSYPDRQFSITTRRKTQETRVIEVLLILKMKKR
jgi:hypothetical protein